MKNTLVPILVVCLATLPTFAFSDEITDAIEEATASYQKGDFSNAVAQLDYASALIRQMKAEGVVAVFCEPLDGWTAEPATSNAAGGMMMGGGIMAERTYRKESALVEISLVMDSPMLQSVAMMINNPAMMTMSGAKLTKIQGNKAMQQGDGGDITISFIINGNALFAIQGNGGATIEDLSAYGECLDLSAL